MKTDFIKKQELSIGNLVMHNDEIGRVVWIQQNEIGWISKNGKGPEQVAINCLKSVDIRSTILTEYLATIQYLRKIADNEYEYDSSREAKGFLSYKIQPEMGGIFLTIHDELCSVKPTTLFFAKMHSFQNFITSIHRDLIE